MVPSNMPKPALPRTNSSATSEAQGPTTREEFEDEDELEEHHAEVHESSKPNRVAKTKEAKHATTRKAKPKHELNVHGGQAHRTLETVIA